MWITGILLLTGIQQVSSQYYAAGEDPSGLRWEQVKTQHFRLIYPADFRENAFRMADILEHYREAVSAPLGHVPKRIPVIIHNHTAESNGFVSWAPRRMELYTTPPQNIYPHDWLEQLAIHEYRHVVQVDKINRGFTRFLSIIGGEQVPGAFSSMLGSWFLEGDAVYAESMLSPSGRGRLPYYEMEMRSRALGGEPFYRFDEALLGSYRKNVPSYYDYGYQMVAYARLKKGNGLWSRTIDNVGKYPFSLFPVHFTLRKEGWNKRRLYEESFEELTRRWKIQDSLEHFIQPEYLSDGADRLYTRYRFPQMLPDSTLVAEKSGIGQVSHFVIITPGKKDKKIHTPGITQAFRLSGRGNLLAWSEILPDARWGNRQYSVIKTYDILSGKERQLSRMSRLFSPALSPETDKIAAVEADEQNTYSLVLLDTESGERLERFPSPGNRFLMMPEWFPDNSRVLAILLDNQGKSLYSLDTRTGLWKQLSRPSFNDILSASPTNEYVFFHSSLSGIDNIYALDLKTSETYKVTSSRFGAVDPFADKKGNKLYYSEYYSQGSRIACMEIDPSRWTPVSEVENHFQGFAGELSPDEPPLVPGNIPAGEHEAKPYRKIFHLFNFHSWMPFYFDPENFYLTEPDLAPGFTLFSQNHLSTATTMLGYAYRDGNHLLRTRFTYRGILPVIELGYHLGGPVSLIKPANVDYEGGFSTTSHTFSGSVSLPLNLTRNRFYSALIPSADFNFYNDIVYNLSSGVFEQNLVSASYRLYYYLLYKTSPRDLYPPWGGIFDISHTSVPGMEETFNPSIRVKAALFFPGLLRHHGLRLEGSYQKQNLVDEYAFIINQEFPRGYEPVFSEELKSFRSDYVFPLIYPDLNLPGVLYIKRLKASFFGDYAINEYRQRNLQTSQMEEISEGLLSFGGTLTFDFHLLRLPFPINAGARISYLPYQGRTVAESIFSIDIYGFSINRR